MHAVRKSLSVGYSSGSRETVQPVVWRLLDVKSFASQVTTGSAARKHQSFKYDDLEIVQSKKLGKKPDWNKLVFGHNFSDHMLSIPWSETKGWDAPRIGPLKNIELHPAAKVLHYAIELFEGLKAYRGVDGRIRLFRPDQNMKRMNSSARRSGLPEFDGNELLRCMAQLIELDSSWVPQSPESSLYIRPTMIGNDPTLGVSRSKECLLYVISGPVGPYFPTGLKPVSLLADPSFVRSWPGSAGAFKMGSNYAPTILVGKEAEKQGCQQVLWLYGEDHQLTEVGTMNIAAYWTNENGEKELVTPPLNGLILPGVTRTSLLELAREWGVFKVTEKNITMKDIIKSIKEKRLIELFGAGTACVICPISRLLYLGRDIHIPVPVEGGDSVSRRFYNELLDIQYGRKAHPWAVDIEDLIQGTSTSAEVHEVAEPRRQKVAARI
ncbi:hypothetical protein RvY_17462 [Ramazzottius varieornatus]|uniref:branched-chain-amino-acid transaminase n=1 Tax=Ramazzottius varieornatus TaxID=947166 RepID=A0A1D1W264_RAMVA|nr:hypothetical protein RvY_17462 [Ramazzottius varieornatus]